MNEITIEIRARILKICKRDSLWTAYVFTVCSGFLLLSILGIHGSSLNLLVNDNSSIVIGNDRPIRSDEFLRNTPFELNRIQFPESSGISQLSESSLNEPGVGFFELLRPERFLLSIFFSGSQLFAALWWMPHLLLFLGVPLFLRSIKLQTKFAIPIAIILAFSPSVVWWSNAIAGIVGRMAFASALIIFSIQKRQSTKFLLGFFGMYLISGTFVDYAPWVIITGIFFASFCLLEFFGREIKPIPTISGMVLGLVPLGLFIHEKSKIFLTLTQTTFPGSRRFEGGANNVSNWAFSAPQQWALLNPEAILASNQSELSLGFLIFLLPAIFIMTRENRRKKISFRILVFSQIYFFLLAWSFVPIPRVGFNPLELVSPERALTVTTTLAPLFFGIVLALSGRDFVINRKAGEQFGEEKVNIKVIVISTLSFYLTLSAAITMKNSVSPFSYPISTLTALSVAIAIGLMLKSKKSVLFGVWIFAFISFLLGITVNPVVHGFSNIYSNDLSRVLSSNESKQTWASNSTFIDAMLTLNGKNQISGQQLNGPSRQQWLKLDPSEKFKEIWNSGASYVQVAFDQASQPPVISRIGGDQILISINPCSDYARKLNLGFIVSTGELKNTCLRNFTSSKPKYLGNSVWMYQITS